VSGDIHCLLAGSGIEHEQGFLRLDQVPQTNQFLDEHFIDLQAPCGIEDQRVAIIGLGEGQGFAGDFEDIGFAFLHENRQLQLLAKFFELIHGGGPIDVGSDQQWGATLFKQEPAEFGAGSGFARAMKADHQDAAWISAEFQAGIGRPEQVD
jgi:hypothetical protein